MASLFEKPGLEDKTEFAYGLRVNPFEVTEDLADRDDPAAGYLDFVFTREVKRLFEVMAEHIRNGQSQKVWFVKPHASPTPHIIPVLGGLFRAMLNAEAPRVFPLYVAMPIVYRDFHGGMLRIMLDRLQPEVFRTLVYSYVFQQLNMVSQEERASEVLPGVDVPELLKCMEETNGEALGELLYPKAKVKPEGEESAEGPEEGEDAGQELEPGRQEGAKDESAEGESESPLVLFLDGCLTQSSFGPLIQTSLSRAFRSLDEGYRHLRAAGEPREAISDVVKLLGIRYNAVVALMDQIEGWDMLQEAEKRGVYGAVADLGWLGDQNLYLAFSGRPAVLEKVGPLVESADVIDIDLGPTRYARKVLPVEEARDLIAWFLDSARSGDRREPQVQTEPDVFPFTDDAALLMAESAAGDPVKLLTYAGKALVEGAGRAIERLDSEFVTAVIAALRAAQDADTVAETVAETDTGAEEDASSPGESEARTGGGEPAA